MNNNSPNDPPLADDGYCFGCGPNNPIGLKLTFGWDDETGDYFTDYTPTREHQGWVGIIHGGLLALVFDEVLSRVVLHSKGHSWMTAELSTRMLRPVPIGTSLRFRGRIVRDGSRLCISEGEARASDGTLIASAKCKMMPVPKDSPDYATRLGGSEQVAKGTEQKSA